MESLWQDLQYAVRMLAKKPGFTILAVLLLAIGIGINSTAFSIINCLFLRSLPVKDPKQLVRIYSKQQDQEPGFSLAAYEDISRQNSSIPEILATSMGGSELNLNGEIQLVTTERVSDNYFSVLGVKPALGQSFTFGERYNEVLPIIISHRLWQRSFSSDPTVIGKTVMLTRRTAVICGVAPSSFTGLKSPMMTEIWIPITAGPMQTRNNRIFDYLYGRLRPDTDIYKAQIELNTIAHRMALAYPETNKGISYIADPVERNFIKNLIISSICLVGPILVLLICCANVSGMLLAKAEERRTEIAVRLALGSNRSRIVRQLLTESLLFSLFATGLGLFFTFWIIRIVPKLLPPMTMSLSLDLRLDGNILIYTLCAALAASLLSGLAPALQVIKDDLIESLKNKRCAGDGKKHSLGLRSILVVGQVALSLILIVSTGFFLKSMILGEKINPGFDVKKQLLIVDATVFSKPQENNRIFFLPVIDQVKSIPGVKAATCALRMPMSTSGGGLACDVSIPGVEPPSGQTVFKIKYNTVGRDFFRVVGTRILNGRAFDRSDEFPEQRTAIVNETMAKHIWKTDPIGRSLLFEGKAYQVVGIAEDNKIEDLQKAPEPYLYFPFSQVPSSSGAIIVETAGDPFTFADAVKGKIRDINKLVLMQKPITLENLMSIAHYRERALAFSSGAIGIIGVILATIGLYAVVAYLARRRMNEIGIRMALGAQSRDISTLMLGKGIRLSIIGIIIGLIASFFIVRLMEAALLGIAPADIWIFSGSVLLVFTISLLASYIPARRAARTNPNVALRYE
jgi:predicted permease